MSFSRKNTTDIKFDYYSSNTIIERKHVVRDLGINSDIKLRFVDHIDTITMSAYKSMGCVIRNAREIEDLSAIKIF